MPLAEAAPETPRTREALDALGAAEHRTHISPFHRAVVWNALGDTDATLEWLERALEEGSTQLVFLAVDPRWDRLRRDTRFGAFCRRVGLG